METKKAAKTVGQQRSPIGWSKSVRAAGKGSAMDSTGGSLSSGGGGSPSESSSCLEDSALLISPPNQATFTEASPRPYFLRGHPKYSSTPLLLPNNDKKDEPLIGVNLEDRLQSLEEHRSLSDDSGFETLPSTEPSSPASSTRPSSPPPRALGALPKRRSPRNLSKNISTKGSGGEAKVEKPSSFVNFTSSGNCFPPSQKRALFKYEPRQHLDGRDTCDMVRMLFEMNLSHVLGLVFQYCGGSHLCAIAQVSQLWNLALVTSSAHNDRRLAWIALRKRNQENDGFTAPSRLGPTSPRRVMQQLNNQQPRGNNGGSGSGGKRDRAGSAAALVSPSKVRHRLFMEEARMLNPGERLTHCPLCTSPSRVSASRAECSSSKCSFLFCPDCLCEHHEGRGCRLTRTGSKVPKSGAVTSKKSKARLRRL